MQKDIIKFSPINGFEIAIVGMAGRFPGAQTIEQFWENLRQGTEAITFFSENELRDEGIDLAQLHDPNYVKAGGFLENSEFFDAAFFGFTPREAELIDPQQRVFLECAWEALEDAGCNNETTIGDIGIFAGCAMNTYYAKNLLTRPDLLEGMGAMQAQISNDKDFLAMRASYKLNLKGPAVTVQNACSTSLVAVHLACQSLLANECALVLAGGISILLPKKSGYLYQPEGILSPDGHCRAFDA